MSRESGYKVCFGHSIYYEIYGTSDDIIICMPGALGTARSDFGPQVGRNY